MPKFTIISEGDDFYTVKDVPIFEMHTDRGFPCDEGWMTAAIKNHEQFKKEGYRPTIIVGHNVPGQEKEAIGFLDRLVLKGQRLYADLVRVPKTVKEKIVRNAFPSRSVEILPQSKRILTLALLGGTTPHFPLPQMTYEENETHLWFRSPEMNELTEEMKKEIYSQVNTAATEAFEKLFASDGEEETVTFTDENGVQYAVPATLAALLGKLKGVAHVGKAAAAGGKAATAVGLPKGVGRAVGRAVGKAGRFVKGHPVGVAGAAGAGVAVGRATKRRKYNIERYAIDDLTGEVYLDGEPLGMVFTYDEMKEVGMDVPTAVKRPQDLPEVEEGSPELEISEEDVGVESGVEEEMQTEPGDITGDNVQELDREESDQFASPLEKQVYNLQKQVSRLETANQLLSEGRRSEEYKQWLEEQRTAGVPVGDIEKTVEFMMSLSPEQVEEHKQLLLAQPRVAFEKAEKTLTFARGGKEAETEVKQDYEQHKETYQALGVNDKDLRWARYVRINRAVGEK